jgi:hypothetical protein
MPYLENKRILQMFCKNRDNKLILLMLLDKMIPLFIANHITTATRNNQSNAERVITQNLHNPLPEDDSANNLTSVCHHLPPSMPTSRLVLSN